MLTSAPNSRVPPAARRSRDVKLPDVRATMFCRDADRTRTTRAVRERMCHQAQATGAVESAEVFRGHSAVRWKYQTVRTGPLVGADKCRPIDMSADGIRDGNEV